MNAFEHPRVLGGGEAAVAAGARGVSNTMPPPLPPSSLTTTQPLFFFFFHGSIRMLRGLNWFVALCVCCLCVRVSCVCVVCCVMVMVEAHHPSVESKKHHTRRCLPAGRGDSEELRFPDTITITVIIQTSAVPQAAPHRPSFSPLVLFLLHTCTQTRLYSANPFSSKQVMIYAAPCKTRARARAIAVQRSRPQRKRGSGSAILYRREGRTLEPRTNSKDRARPPSDLKMEQVFRGTSRDEMR
jgi:hypothetical protein